MTHPTHDRRVRSTAGFSLIEVLVAITIIGLMVGVVGFNVFGALFQSRRDRAAIEIASFAEAVQLYRSKEGKLPTSGDWPDFLINGSKKYKRPYIDDTKLEDGRLVDPWGNEYIYKKMSGSKFDIISYGEDGAPGGEDDSEDIHFLPESKR